jgi:4'-phosphopantetheinyl transferase
VTGSTPSVHLYYADSSALPDDVVGALVTSEDRARLTPAMRPRRRAEYLAGRALLRHALRRYTGRDASSLTIDVTPDGKPRCAAGPEISVSHSSDVVVCAVGDPAAGALGIDVEISAPREIDDIVQRYFTPAEARWVAADPVPRFRMLWVLKEAYLKVLGIGLAGGLDSLECRIEPPRIDARVAGGAAPQLKLLAGRGGFAGVAAASPFELTIERWAPLPQADVFGPLAVIATT